ncbi:Y4yA family PLP-dependent enzyme [Actinomycetospora sp.]|uniref:Y4yA family PLP-dependent enzyme n=1 Tax=Actinomycetospora sp. TaxID=1872135 RepID=UPI002F422E46
MELTRTAAAAPTAHASTGEAARRDTPTLPARSRPWSARLLEDPRALGEMARHAGGPFHVLHPATFAENVRGFQNALLSAGVDGHVLYGKKANRSDCFLRACVDTGAGVDVASAPELTHALAAGLHGEDLVVTGPAKSDELLRLALRHGALLAVDAPDEFARLVTLARNGRPARVLLRVLPPTDPHSRFGVDADELDEVLDRAAEARDAVEIEGFSFHLSGYEPEPRAELAAALVDRCLAARSLGHAATAISIGGGFGVSYVDAADWDRFLAEHDDGDYHAGRRPPRFYPYHQEPAKADMLAAILGHRSGGGPSLAEQLSRNGIRLLLEPGRALLDGAGFSVFGVQGYKRRGGVGSDGREHGIVTVDGLSMSISEQWKGSEFLPDPELWPRAPIVEPVAACVGGASCLEYDMLTWRRVPFPRSPQHGDLLVYPNTAGYQMDKNESRFHQLPLPARFVARGPSGDAVPTWRPEW